MKINPQKIEGNWEEGWAMDLHTTSSTYIGDVDGKPKFENTYSPIAEELNKLKYRNDKNRADNISKPVAEFVSEKQEQWNVGLIIPVPPSNTNRVYQPVNEIVNLVGRKLELSVDYDTLKKNKETVPLKTIDTHEEKQELLKDAFIVEPDSLNGKNVLIFDDIFDSGETLKSITDVFLKQGNAEKVYVLTVTKTRVKK